jgi:hypothetical protein
MTMEVAQWLGLGVGVGGITSALAMLRAPLQAGRTDRTPDHARRRGEVDVRRVA